MICVADSGSTKTDWVFFLPGQGETDWIRLKSPGTNPYYMDSSEITVIAEAAADEALIKQTTHLYFYGAGCSSPERIQIVLEGLQGVYQNASIEVNHDLLAAAHASCEGSSGVVSILGTGSNSCKFDGENIVDNIDNLGFFLGDEGSGGDIGRRLVRARTYREMPTHIESAFDEAFHWDREALLKRVHEGSQPNRYLASFAPFCADRREDPFIQTLLEKAFSSFIDHHLMKYGVPEWEHHFIGSIAWYYREELERLLTARGLLMGSIVRHPINPLVKYHQRKHEV